MMIDICYSNTGFKFIREVMKLIFFLLSKENGLIIKNFIILYHGLKYLLLDFFFFLGHTHGIWRFPGLRSD